VVINTPCYVIADVADDLQTTGLLLANAC